VEERWRAKGLGKCEERVRRKKRSAKRSEKGSALFQGEDTKWSTAVRPEFTDEQKKREAFGGGPSSQKNGDALRQRRTLADNFEG